MLVFPAGLDYNEVHVTILTADMLHMTLGPGVFTLWLRTA